MELTPELQDEVLQHEKEQILLEQIELSTIMVNPIPLKKLWIHNAIQFGFIAFFVLSFPAAAIIGLIINLFHINFLYFSFTDHLKRRPSVERGNIGIWNSIFLFMSFIALVINIAILVFSSEGLTELLQRNNSFSLTQENVIIILIIAEHIVFLIKFILTLIINDKPKWVSSYLHEQNYKRQIDEERIKKKMLAKLHKFKQKKKKKKFKNKLIDKISATIDNEDGGIKRSALFRSNKEKDTLKKDDE